MESFPYNSEDSVGMGIVVAAPKLKPAIFDGQSSLPIFLCKFGTVADNSRWSLEDKNMALVLALRKQALQTLQNVPEAERRNFEVV